jgi:LytS/YehU family sensor histidine kinase
MALLEPFLLIAAAILLALTAILVRQRRRFAARIADLEARRLKGQLTPHFLFNALNGISELGYDDPEAADRAITRLSGLLRKSLEEGERQEISLKAEFEFLEDYLALQRLLTRDLKTTITLDPTAQRARVPAMILQPLVENALIHGRGADGAAIAIAARRSGKMLQLEVRDHGPGPGKARDPARQGIGIANTRARLHYLCGADASVALQAGAEGGAITRILLPYREVP